MLCSGCVTSAETVLITQQSAAEFYAHLPSFATNPNASPASTNAPVGATTSAPMEVDMISPSVGPVSSQRVVIVTVSPASRASLAQHYQLSLLDTAKRLQTFLTALGVSHVLDSSFGKYYSDPSSG